MEFIFETLNLYTKEIVLVALGLALIIVILLFINFIRTSKIIKKYNTMMKGMENKNLEFMLLNHLKAVERTNTDIQKLKGRVENISQQLDGCIQRMAVLRYNPFQQMGGDQSFSISLLDDMGNGVVISGLYSREGSTVYAKPLIKYKSKYPLSTEEEQVIEMAKNK